MPAAHLFLRLTTLIGTAYDSDDQEKDFPAMSEQVRGDTPFIGGHFGPYHVRRKIGQGGMGEVYEGWDERLGRAIAIKKINESTASSDAKDRLWREARSLARVNHPNVCHVFDVVENGDVLLIILELLEGQSLAQRLISGSIVTSMAVGFEREILRALEALHRLNIVHRDLKPSNVFVTPHGIKLLDFGLAWSSEATEVTTFDSLPTALTIPGMVVGTPQYMSPEQAVGRVASPRSDLFAAGCIFYEMLTGKRPFDGASSIDVLHAVLHQNPQPLSGSRGIEALDQVIRRALRKEPSDRYQSAQEMLEAIETVSLSQSTAVVAQTRRVARLIAIPFRVLKKDEESEFLAYALPDAISNSLAGLETLIVRSTAMGARFELPPDPKQVAVEAEVDSFLTGSIMHAGNSIRLACQLVQAPSGTLIWSDTVTSSMHDLFRVQDELCEHIVQSLMLPLSEREQCNLRRDVPATPEAYEYYLRANQISSIRSLENMRLARDLYLQCVEEDPNYAPGWARLGRVHAFVEKFGEGDGQDQKLAHEAFRKAFALNPDLALAHNLYTPIECDDGNAVQAMVRLLKRAQFRRNDPDLFAGLVQACRYCDELDASVAAFDRASHLDARILTSVAHTYFLLGDYSRAVETYGTKAGYYLDCAALAAMGDDAAALDRLKSREIVGVATGTIMRSLRAYLEGDIEKCIATSNSDHNLLRKTPESLYYLARHLARVNAREQAISLLFDVIDCGFLCGSAIMRDPWLDSLRLSPRFTDLLGRAEEKRKGAHAAFIAAGGLAVLDIKH
jgi:serine/threonine protein kinase